MKKETFQEVLKRITRDELYQYYIVENNSYNSLLDKYQLSGWTLDKLLRTYELKKDKTVAALNGVKNRYERAGGKSAYDSAVREKVAQQYLDKFGSYDNYRQYISNKCKLSWGGKSPEEIAAITEERRRNYYNVPEKIEHAKEVRAETNLRLYGVDNTFALSDYTTSSKVNTEFYELLIDAGFECEQEFLLRDVDRTYRYDFRIGNTLIELNPWPFHNSTTTPNGATPLTKNYHYNKTRCAVSQGYRVINVWDWDSRASILDLIIPRPKVFARKCIVKEVSREDAISFINNYHLQGYSNDKVRLGLYYNNQLVSIMTFGKPRYNKTVEWELVRYCSSYSVLGGAEKLFNFFVKNYHPKSMVSYCDRSKFTGQTYLKLGFQEVGTSISKHWFNYKTSEHLLDSSLRMRGFDVLLGKKYGCYGKGTSNDELMKKHNFVEIYDAGQTTYIKIFE